jgi:hypothetical protein
MSGVLHLTLYFPVCSTQRQIDPFFGPYFQYLAKFNCICLTVLYPVYEGVSSRTPYPCQEIYTNVLKIVLWPLKAVQLTTSLLIYQYKFSPSPQFSYVPMHSLSSSAHTDVLNEKQVITSIEKRFGLVRIKQIRRGTQQ